MKICLYRAFPDSYRQSMTLYADELTKNIRPLLRPEENLEDYLPQSIRTSPSWLRYFSQYFLYQQAVSRVRADIHHIVDHSYAHLLHSLPSAKTAITFHDAIGLENSKGAGRGLLRRYNLSALKKAGALIFDSEASRAALLKYVDYPEERGFLVYPGLDSIFFQTPAKNPFEVLRIPPGLYMLHVGHTGDYKNIPALFHVLAGLRKKGMDIKLLKTGMPFTVSQNNLADQLKIASQIIHLGLVKREQMPLVYRAAQCLLFPSYNEGFGFPVLEAMASGTPVVSSNRGSLPELSIRPETLLEPEDYRGMEQQIVEVIQNLPLRSGLITKGQEKARGFQWKNTGRKILDIYRKLST